MAQPASVEPAKLSSNPPALGPSTIDSSKRLDFAYELSDDRIQAFDDGKVTRISLPAGTLIPLVVATEPRGEVVLTPRIDPPYLVLAGLHAQLQLRWAQRASVSMTYVGALTAGRAPMAASFGSVAPLASLGAVATPTSRDAFGRARAAVSTVAMPALATVAADEVATLKATVAAMRDEQSRHQAQQAQTDQSVKNRVAELSQQTATAVDSLKAELKRKDEQLEAARPVWHLSASDKWLTAALSRWSTASGLSFAAIGESDLPVLNRWELKGTLAQAIAKLNVDLYGRAVARLVGDSLTLAVGPSTETNATSSAVATSSTSTTDQKE